MAHPVPVCLADLQALAKEKLPRNVWDYYESGSDDMITLKRNETAFSRIRIKPRVLRDVSEIKLHTTLLGAPVASPIAVAPSAMHRMAHPDGEEATARACASMRTAMILSTMSTTSMEDVAEASEEAQIDPLSLAAKMPSPQKTEPVRWYQLYVFKDREVTRQLVERAEAAGYKALVVTVDAPYLGRRRPDMRNEFKMPGYLRLANFEHADMRKRQLSTTKSNESALAIYFKEQIDPTLNWQDIAWLRTITNLPIIAKGIMTEEDAKDAVAAGVSGIIVSNHGGRQLDGAPATIEVLEEVVKAVGNRVEVYMDGGVRRGSDVFKALALGARAVFVGRPALWGLAYKGEEGVRTMLRLLEEELHMCMALAGCQSLHDLKPSLLIYDTVTARL